jgi:hypothetical protein
LGRMTWIAWRMTRLLENGIDETQSSQIQNLCAPKGGEASQPARSPGFASHPWSTGLRSWFNTGHHTIEPVGGIGGLIPSIGSQCGSVLRPSCGPIEESIFFGSTVRFERIGEDLLTLILKVLHCVLPFLNPRRRGEARVLARSDLAFILPTIRRSLRAEDVFHSRAELPESNETRKNGTTHLGHPRSEDA